jgi:hypothetical protein
VRLSRILDVPRSSDPSPSIEAAEPHLRAPHLVREWGNKETAIRYLKNAGFVLRRDLSFAPPLGRKRLNPKDRRAIEYLVLEWGFVGLLTEAQHAERKRQKADSQKRKSPAHC